MSGAEDLGSGAEGPASGAEDLAAATPGNPATSPHATEAGVPAPSREPSVLELRYRRLLRLLPRGYREVRADEMVGTFLATMYDADPDNFDLTLKHGRPSGAEMRAILRLAIQARWGETVAPERFAARTCAAHIVLFTGVTIMWAFATAQLVGIGLAFIIDPVPVDSPAITDTYREMLALPAGSWAWWSTWAYLGWTVTLPLLVFGGRAGARWAAACAAVPVVVAAIAWARDGSGYIAGALGLVVTVMVLVGLVALAVREGARGAQSEAGSGRTSRRPAVRFLAVGSGIIVILIAYMALVWLGFGRMFAEPVGWVISFDAGWWTVAAVALGARLVLHRGRPGADPATAAGRATGCAVVAGVGTVLSAAWAWTFLAVGSDSDRGGSTLEATSAAEMAVASSIFVISAVVAARRMRALPRGRYAAVRAAGIER
jgi:hypothetical protein